MITGTSKTRLETLIICKDMKSY